MSQAKTETKALGPPVTVACNDTTPTCLFWARHVQSHLQAFTSLPPAGQLQIAYSAICNSLIFLHHQEGDSEFDPVWQHCQATAFAWLGMTGLQDYWKGCQKL